MRSFVTNLSSLFLLNSQHLLSVHAVDDSLVPKPTAQSELPDGAVRGEQMILEAPTMTEEDQYGYNLPKQYQCNACQAVMHHLNEKLTAAAPKSRVWKNWEFVDEVDNKICVPDTFDGYGLKKIAGKNALSGPALSHMEPELVGGAGSIQMGGESWKKRLAEECRKIVNDKFDDEIFGFFKDGKLNKNLCFEHNYCDDELKDKEEKAKAKEADREEKRKAKEAKKAAKEAKKAAKAAEKAEKGDSKKKDKKPKESKKISLEAYITKLSRKNALSYDNFTKPRTEEEWVKDLQLLTELLGKEVGKDEL